jgi:hypothetical protein
MVYKPRHCSNSATISAKIGQNRAGPIGSNRPRGLTIAGDLLTPNSVGQFERLSPVSTAVDPPRRTGFA